MRTTLCVYFFIFWRTEILYLTLTLLKIYEITLHGLRALIGGIFSASYELTFFCVSQFHSFLFLFLENLLANEAVDKGR